MTLRIKATIAYDGTRFEGWQVQACSHRKRPLTIQGELEAVLHKMTGAPISVHGSGRTDSGVHAEAQVCHFDIPKRTRHFLWLRALNAQLPQDIRVLALGIVPGTFHARKDALKKTYSYALFSGTAKPFPRVAPYCWRTPHLDVSLMQKAASYLVGTHDFAGLQNSGVDRSSTVRTIFSISCHKGDIAGITHPLNWPVISWNITGDGFLKQMVRNIMGLLVYVGQKKIAPHTVPTLLKEKKRQVFLSPTAPAQGLTLLQVDYPPHPYTLLHKDESALQ